MADKRKYNFLIPSFFTKKEVEVEKPIEPKAQNNNYSLVNTYSISFDGEKNLGEAGPIISYKLNPEALRIRSWQSYLENDISQTVLDKFTTWIIGSGLKLQSEPLEEALKSEGINIDTEKFNKLVEARFSIFSKSKNIDFSKQKNLHQLAKRCYIDSIVGGDTLCILRYKDDKISIQLVDGGNVKSPMVTDSYYGVVKNNGNSIVNGVEISSTGEHIAYYVRVKGELFKTERVPAKINGIPVAFMIYGREFRLNDVRGIPLITTVMETLKKLERYKEAMVGSAEELAKIVYQIIHQQYSTGENPALNQLAKVMDVDGAADLPKDINGKQLADTVAASTNKETFNMPIGAELKPVNSNQKELYFKDFYGANAAIVCACIGIPPEVAFSKYDSNFSASRAALKDWEHTVFVRRKAFQEEFYQNIYNFWFHIEVLKNKIQAPGYLKAMQTNDDMVLESYRNCRFVGASIPHIDPLKEVQAEREKLGEQGKSIPLTTVEQATEALSGGESYNNIQQFARELELVEKLKIIKSQDSGNNN